jgi:SPP1 gp7 family putative phage head morphogenesis protein
MAKLANNAKPIPQILAAKVAGWRQVGRRRRRPVKLPKPPLQRTPKKVERDYRRNLLKVMANAKGLVNELLISRLKEIQGEALTVDSARRDIEDWPEKVKRIGEQLRLNFEREQGKITQAAEEMGSQLSAENSKQIAKQSKAVLGVDVIAADPKLATTLKASLEENVSLIKTLVGDYFSKVEDTVLRGFRSGQRATSMVDAISKLTSKGRKHAEFIARDQVLKLNGSLTRNRQRDLGVDKYVWRTSLDERVREDHLKLEGTVHSWKGQGPITDSRTGARNHPGMDFNCRCTAEPYIAELLDEGQDELENEKRARELEAEKARKETAAKREALASERRKQRVKTRAARSRTTGPSDREAAAARARTRKNEAELKRVRAQTKKAQKENDALKARIKKMEREVAKAKKETRALDLKNTRLERRRGSEG